MPILNQQHRDRIIRIVTKYCCQTEYELQFLKSNSQKKIQYYLDNAQPLEFEDLT